MVEFASLWTYLSQWKVCFDSYDRDRSGTIDANELRTALFSFGYNLSVPFVQSLCMKFSRKRGVGAGAGITFDNFISLCASPL